MVRPVGTGFDDDQEELLIMPHLDLETNQGAPPLEVTYSWPPKEASMNFSLYSPDAAVVLELNQKGLLDMMFHAAIQWHRD